ncbi:MAG: IS110 family transposase [Polyangiaceae bacterium]
MSSESDTRFVGLDVHREVIAICMIDARGERMRLGSERIPSRRAALRAWLAKEVREPARTKFLLEALSPAFWVIDVLQEIGLDVTLADPRSVRLIAESKKKSDRVDAHALAQSLRLGAFRPAYIATRAERALRLLVRLRGDLRKTVTEAKNRVHSLLHMCDEHFEGSDVFGKGGRRWLGALALEEDVRFVLDMHLRTIDEGEEKIAVLDERIAASCAEDPDVALLRTIPGAGPAHAATIRAEAGDLRRFDTPGQFVSYCGLAPGTRESAGKQRDGAITKQGNADLRYAIVAVSMGAARWSKEWRDRYARLRRRIKKYKARIAMARRLAVAIWHMAQNGEVFRYQERPPREKSAAEAA